MVRALALFSGGLDSALSARVVLDEDVDVEAVYFVNAFLSNIDISLQKRQVAQLGIKLHILDISRPHLEIVQNPRYGYGKNMNPCIDCRILMLRHAKAYMQEHGFDFLVSGEVLGQRPMSQRRNALNIIERDADVKGLLLRPLSARLLKVTLAEEKGWVNRERLLDFSGRTRRPQLALAEAFGIREYLTPAGGCLLTEAEFSRKLKDLTSFGKAEIEDVQLLKLGRHFRAKNSLKIIIGRNEEENGRLMDLAKDEDVLVKMRDFTGPLTLLRTNGLEETSNGEIPKLIETAARLTARYSKGKDEERTGVDYWSKNSGEKRFIQVVPAGEDLIARMRI